MLSSVPRILLTLSILIAAALPAAAETIGVIYLESVFEQSKLVEQRSAQLRQVAKEVQEAGQAMAKEVENLETELQIRPPNHPKYGDFKEQYEVAKLRLKLFQERQSQRLQQQEMELLQQSYEDLRLLIEEFAKERDLGLMFLVSDAELQAPNTQSLRLQLAQRAVLYHRDSMDQTAAFVAFANSRFRGGDDATPAEGEGDEASEVP